MENNSNKDISVFTFTRGSQTQSNLVNSESYGFVLGVINSMMKKSGVDTPKVGFGGTKEDVCCFITGLIQYQIMYNINIEYMVNDTSEYDPDDNPEDYEDELG